MLQKQHTYAVIDLSTVLDCYREMTEYKRFVNHLLVDQLVGQQTRRSFIILLLLAE